MAEQPPLDVIVEGDERYDYIMRREKNIRKGTFQKKLGRLVVQSAQPQSLKLPYPRGPNADCTPTTMATVNVRFDPVEESSPLPSLNTLQAKLKVATCFASVPLDEIPTKSSDFHCSSVRGIFVETVNLSSLCLSNIEWEKKTPSTDLPNRRNSWIPDPSKAYNGGSYYTAKVAVPVSLSKGNKVLVPSFHSCLVSRIYALDLYLSLSTPGATVTDPTIQLKLPLQVSSEGNPNATPIISAQVWFNPYHTPDSRSIDYSLTSSTPYRNRQQLQQEKQTRTWTLRAWSNQPQSTRNVPEMPLHPAQWPVSWVAAKAGAWLMHAKGFSR